MSEPKHKARLKDRAKPILGREKKEKKDKRKSSEDDVIAKDSRSSSKEAGRSAELLEPQSNRDTRPLGRAQTQNDLEGPHTKGAPASHRQLCPDLAPILISTLQNMLKYSESQDPVVFVRRN